MDSTLVSALVAFLCTIIGLLLVVVVVNQNAISKKKDRIGEQVSKLNNVIMKKDGNKSLVQKMHPSKPADLGPIMEKIQAEFKILKRELDKNCSKEGFGERDLKLKEVTEDIIQLQKKIEIISETIKAPAIVLSTMDSTLAEISKSLKKFDSLKKFEKDLIPKLKKLESLYLANKKVLSFEDALEITGFKASYLYKLTSTNAIPHSNPTGRKIFFHRNQLEAWLLGEKTWTLKENQESKE